MDEGQDRVKASYRGNYDRLTQLKHRYDPDNTFHINQKRPARQRAPAASPARYQRCNAPLRTRRPWMPSESGPAASAISRGRRSGGRSAGEESLVRLGDPRAVLGGEQVQEEAPDHGHGEPGVGSGRPFVCARLDHDVGDRGDPRLDDPVEESLGAGAAAQGVGIQLKEQPLLRP